MFGYKRLISLQRSWAFSGPYACGAKQCVPVCEAMLALKPWFLLSCIRILVHQTFHLDGVRDDCPMVNKDTS